MKSQKINPFIADCQLSFWSNTTHIGLTKLLFKRDALHYIQKAIEDIFTQIETSRKAGLRPGQFTSEIPYTIFPDVKKALSKFNKKHDTDFLVLYFKHSPIGIIKESLPVSVPVCPECGIMVKKQMVKPEPLAWWKNLIHFFFRGAFEREPLWTFECNTHGEVKNPPYIVM
jgi:hypothetical protein